MTTAAVPPDLEDRAPTPGDLRPVLDLITACDIEDIGAPDSSLADLAADWAYARFDLGRDARLLVAPDGTVRAYVAIRQYDPGRRFWVDLYVHPHDRDGAVERWGIASAEERAAHLAAVPDAALFLYAEDGSELARLSEELGYEDVRRMFRMELELTSLLPPPEDPDGIAIRTFDPSEARPVHAALEEAFADEWGHRQEPFDEWAARKLEHAGFDPSTWWIAWDGDEVVGMVLASIDEGVEGAWIGTVAVRQPWRGRGLALALLRTAFHGLSARGVPHVALGVDSENPTGATRLYERAGMRVTKRWVRYQRPVPVGPETGRDQ